MVNIGDVAEGFGITYKTLSYGKSEFTNASFVFIFVLIMTFIAIYGLLRLSFYLGSKKTKVSSKLALLPAAFLIIIGPLTIWYILSANLRFSMSEHWQADYFAFTVFMFGMLMLSFYKYNTPGSGSTQSIWTGVFKMSVFTMYALIATPMFVWSVGQKKGVEEGGPVWLCMGFMIVLIYFLMVTIMTRGSVFSFMLPAMIMNGSCMFYYETFKVAFLHGMVYNLTIVIYFAGSMIGNQFFTSRKNKYTAGIYSIIIIMYAFTVMFFWPALSLHYTGSIEGHSYSSFRSESFYPDSW